LCQNTNNLTEIKIDSEHIPFHPTYLSNVVSIYSFPGESGLFGPQLQKERQLTPCQTFNNLNLTCTLCHNSEVTHDRQHEIKQQQQAEKSEGKVNFSISFIFFLHSHIARVMFGFEDE